MTTTDTLTDEQAEQLRHLFKPGRHTRRPMPPLQYAVYNIWYGGKKPILALLEAGAPLDAMDENGNTALSQAVYEDKPKIYALLLQAGANQHIENRYGDTPAQAFKRKFGMSCEEKFKGQTIDAAYFRKERDGL